MSPVVYVKVAFDWSGSDVQEGDTVTVLARGPARILSTNEVVVEPVECAIQSVDRKPGASVPTGDAAIVGASETAPSKESP